MKNRIRCLFLGFAAIHAASASTPGNLIPNGDFATSTEGWTCAGTCSWSPQNADSPVDDGTGSIAFPNAQDSQITSSCFAVSPQTQYSIGMQALDNVGPVGDDFQMMCTMFTDTNCGTLDSSSVGVLTQVFYTPTGPGALQWESSYPSTFTTGSDDRSAECTISGGNYGVDTAFDAIYFAPPDPIFANGFES